MYEPHPLRQTRLINTNSSGSDRLAGFSGSARCIRQVSGNHWSRVLRLRVPSLFTLALVRKHDAISHHGLATQADVRAE